MNFKVCTNQYPFAVNCFSIEKLLGDAKKTVGENEIIIKIMNENLSISIKYSR